MMHMPNTQPDFCAELDRIADDYHPDNDSQAALALDEMRFAIAELADRARAALAAEQLGPLPVARLMHWNGKGGNLNVTTPIARTFAEMPKGEAHYWDEGDPLFVANQTGGQP